MTTTIEDSKDTFYRAMFSFFLRVHNFFYYFLFAYEKCELDKKKKKKRKIMWYGRRSEWYMIFVLLEIFDLF